MFLYVYVDVSFYDGVFYGGASLRTPQSIEYTQLCF
jgi:hypothetical protein